ncbi:MAG: patatin-like phospholipase family protein [Anaerolineales bacterium]
MNITLALGGGGVKGFAHVGVLRILEREGYQIKGIAGTSIGGLIGTLYAAGLSPDEMEIRLRQIDQENLFSRMHGDGPALLGLTGVTDILRDLLGDKSFDDLRLPLAVTASDLTTGLPVVIKTGKLLEAILATSAVPGVFPPRSMGRHLLVDGGVTNPIPVEEARILCSHAPVIAVILSPSLGWQKHTEDEFTGTIPVLMTNLPLVYRLAGRLRLAQAFNLFINSMDLMSLTLVDKQLRLEKPEVVIRPTLGEVGIVDQVDIPKLIKEGELATTRALPDIRKLGSWHRRLTRRLSEYLAAQGSDAHGS